MWHHITGAPQLTEFIINPQIDFIPLNLKKLVWCGPELWFMFIPNYNFGIPGNMSKNLQGRYMPNKL